MKYWLVIPAIILGLLLTKAACAFGYDYVDYAPVGDAVNINGLTGERGSSCTVYRSASHMWDSWGGVDGNLADTNFVAGHVESDPYGMLAPGDSMEFRLLGGGDVAAANDPTWSPPFYSVELGYDLHSHSGGWY